jgi:hypothetical protein
MYPQYFIISLFFSAEVDSSLQLAIEGLSTNLTPTKEVLVQVPPRRLSPSLQLMQFWGVYRHVLHIAEQAVVIPV